MQVISLVFKQWLLCYLENKLLAGIRVALDFGSGKSRIQPFFRNRAKSSSGQIFSRICQIWLLLVQLQYVQLIMDKTTRTTKVQNPLPFHKFCQKLASSDVTKEALNYIASL